jgi:O-glycosyl hydrolase
VAEQTHRRWRGAGWVAPATLLLGSILTALSFPASGTAAAGRSALPTAEVSAGSAQTMNGFGASGAWWPNDLVRFPASVQEQVADQLFTSSGIDLSVYRYNIGAGGVGVTSPTRSVQSFLVRPGVYDWSADPGGTRFLELAHDRGVPILEGFANSAPPEWTTDHRSCGGQLTPGDERSYAAYLGEVAHHFAVDGIDLRVVSPMNEPDNSFGSCGQEGMAVPVAQRATVVRDLGRDLARRAPFAQVIADESSLATFQFLPEVPRWLTAGSTSRWLAALAHHTYEYPTDAEAAMVSTLGPRFGQALWMTEICCYDGKGPLVGFGPQYDPTMTSGLWLADSVYQDVAVIGDAQFDWWTALSSQLGCRPVDHPGCVAGVNGSGWNDGLLYYDPAYAQDGDHAITATKRYYVLGNFSRYVRPGAVRHPVTGVPSGVRALAFEGHGDWTVVVIDDGVRGSAATRLGIRLPGGAAARPVGAVRTSAVDNLANVSLPRASHGIATVTIPPQSVTTYTFGA